MGIFSKMSENEFKSLHNDNLFGDDDDILIPASQRKNRQHNVGNGSVHAPHAITPDELSGNRTPEPIPMERSGPNSVYERMKQREQESRIAAIEDDYVPSWATANIPETKPEPTVKEPTVKEPVAVTTPVETVKTETHSAFSDAFLERCRIAVEKASENDERLSRKAEPVKPITLYEPEKETVKAPSSTTRSVDEIIKMLRGESETPDKTENLASAESVEATAEEPVNTKDSKKELPADLKVEVEVIPTDSDSDIMHTTKARNNDSDMRVYGKIVKGAVIQQTPDGDVEGSEFVKPKVTQDTIIADDKTIMFGELGDIISKRAEADFTEYKLTHSDDEEFYDEDHDDYLDDTPYYETEPRELSDTEDYKTLDDAARLLTKLSAEKSRNKILTVFSLIATAIMLLFTVTFGKMMPSSSLNTINLLILAATLLINLDIFKDFRHFTVKRLGFDSATALTSTVLLIQSAVSSFVFDGKYDGFAIAGVILLAANRLMHLLKATRILNGLTIIANSDEKRSVVLEKGKTAGTISSGAIDGEAIVLCDRKAVNIKNYLKACGYLSPIDLKITTLVIVSTVISIITLLAVGLLLNFGLGLTIASAILLCFFPATALLTCELPMFLASKKAHSYGAMLAGYKGAYELNLANLVAVSSSDLFPEGSVSLYNMKTLGENEIGKTLLDAGAVAEAANSPLAGIFKSIIGAEYKLNRPKVNGVQYEDKMGISGWIGERTILIGNRNLMQGHNVTVPPASVDQKILRAGYFPVYIAVNSVPCLLFIVKYDTDPEVAEHLQKLCNTGMTVVVDPKDPNTSSAMICDYFGLPDDALRVMNHNGRVAYSHTSAYSESCSALAAFHKNVCGFFSAVTSAIKLNTTYRILTAIFTLAAVSGGLLLVCLALSSNLGLINGLTVAGFQLLFAAISFIIAKVRS